MEEKHQIITKKAKIFNGETVEVTGKPEHITES